MAKALINVPASVKKGEVFEIKTLISHPMETGFRTGPDGARLPRNIIQRFSCTYNGEEIFAATLYPAISANPFFAFSAIAKDSGELTFRWIDEHGAEQVETARIVVV